MLGIVFSISALAADERVSIRDVIIDRTGQAFDSSQGRLQTGFENSQGRLDTRLAGSQARRDNVVNSGTTIAKDLTSLDPLLTIDTSTEGQFKIGFGL